MSTGLQGHQGIAGQQGAQGRQGQQGQQGSGGGLGTQGYQGFQGAQGFQGRQGFQGTQGFQGFQGPDIPGLTSDGDNGIIVTSAGNFGAAVTVSGVNLLNSSGVTTTSLKGDTLNISDGDTTINDSAINTNKINCSGVISGDGSGLTTLNGSNVASGTVADARLSANVALKNINNSFSTGQTVTGTLAATTLTGAGSGITALNGSNVASGTVADARLSSNVALKNINNSFSTGQTVTGTLAATALTGAGSGITNLNGTNIASGTVADARLSSNVALKNTNNSFSTHQTVSGVVNATLGFATGYATLVEQGSGSEAVLGASGYIRLESNAGSYYFGDSINITEPASIFSGANSVDVGNSQLIAGSILSLDWSQRYLYDSSTYLSVDWTNRQCYDGGGYPSANWANRALYDNSGSVTSVDWGNRVLYDQGIPQVIWYNGIFMPNLPTSNPGVAGQVWNDDGDLMISSGPVLGAICENPVDITGIDGTTSPYAIDLGPSEEIWFRVSYPGGSGTGSWSIDPEFAGTGGYSNAQNYFGPSCGYLVAGLTSLSLESGWVNNGDYFYLQIIAGGGGMTGDITFIIGSE